jgi:hypothetical protein
MKPVFLNKIFWVRTKPIWFYKSIFINTLHIMFWMKFNKILSTKFSKNRLWLDSFAQYFEARKSHSTV